MAKSFLHRFASRYRKNKLVSEFLSKTGSDLQPQQWVFIIGCYNSGTTLLEKILTGHKSIAGLNDEGVILTNQLSRPEDFEYNRIWYPVASRLYIDPKSPSAPNIAQTVKKHWSHFYDKTKTVFLEKSISNALRIDFLNRFFSPASFIYIVRNGYAVAEGIRRKGDPQRFDRIAEKNYPLAMCVRQWVESDRVITEALADKRHLTIRYEELTENIHETMRNVCEFLKIKPFSADQLAGKVSVHGRLRSVRNMNNASVANLTDDDIQMIRREAGEVLARYNYSA